MHLDAYGLPIQSDGDAEDQLNRVGLLVSSFAILDQLNEETLSFAMTARASLQVDGVYKRHVNGNHENVSADQLIPMACAWRLLGYRVQLNQMYRRMINRFGFAQNIVDGLNGDHVTKKIPDFMFLRAAPVFFRDTKWRYFWDIYLFVLVIGDWFYLKTDKDPADVNVTACTFLVALKVNPTFVSKLAWKLWRKLRPGLEFWIERYHRAEAKGNPEVGDLLIKAIWRVESL